ncbi:uncharacterized protein LOC133930302 [Phragmites australis]|uniref:uncharacterized protein LOC133929257 n=1 Tax=Phragmites australis TaxID=29695 RepID=UPI002D7709CF|nr:uncharacterized protein LOC133929257 [Phragmites australis]XP_062232915.1 uncharacterized protein LOC133930302 [Phragmites australis]
MPIQFPLYPKHLMPIHEVYRRPNKTFVDIAGVVVHWCKLEHVGNKKPYREVILMDERFNLIVVGIWSELLEQYTISLQSAGNNKHVIIGTMLKLNKRHRCLETSVHTSFAFNPTNLQTRKLHALQRSLVTGKWDLRFVNRFIEKRWAYLATVV